MENFGTARQATDDNIIWLMRLACWINKATNTHAEYVMFIPFTRQKWLRERASILRFYCTASPALFTQIFLKITDKQIQIPR